MPTVEGKKYGAVKKINKNIVTARLAVDSTIPILATGRGVQLTCVPISLHGAADGNYPKPLHGIMPAPGEPGAG